MFVYCDKCKWTQDDFWSEEGDCYNPFNYVAQYQKYVFERPRDDMDWRIADEKTGDVKTVSRLEYVATLFESMAKTIRKQKYITYEDYLEQNPEGLCPECDNPLTLD